MGMIAALLPQQILICAPSNAAVDELLLRIDAGIYDSTGQMKRVKVIRLGEPLEGSSALIKSLTLDNQTEKVLKKDNLWLKLVETNELVDKLELELRQIGNFGPSHSLNQVDSQLIQTKSNPIENKCKAIRLQLFELRRQLEIMENEIERLRGMIKKGLLNDANIVCSTLSGSGRQQFLDHIVRDDVVFETCIIDEAAQSSEPSTLIPLRFGCRRLVLVGDPRQLPATVLSKRSGFNDIEL